MELDSISPQKMLKSLNIETNRSCVFSAGEGAGASGSFFFHTKDNMFIIKTLRGSEREVLLKMLEDMIAHYKSTKNWSLLSRIYGLFTIKSNKFDPVDVIIMQNTCQLTDPKCARMTFDLKGSKVHRRTPVTHKFWNTSFNYKKILKCLNFIEINKDNGGILQLSEKDSIHLETLMI